MPVCKYNAQFIYKVNFQFENYIIFLNLSIQFLNNQFVSLNYYFYKLVLNFLFWNSFYLKSNYQNVFNLNLWKLLDLILSFFANFFP